MAGFRLNILDTKGAWPQGKGEETSGNWLRKRPNNAGAKVLGIAEGMSLYLCDLVEVGKCVLVLRIVVERKSESRGRIMSGESSILEGWSPSF